MTEQSTAKPSIVFMFSGQGSQYYQMAKDLYLHHRVFTAKLEYCAEVIKSHQGPSIIDELFSKPMTEEFDDLAVTHPTLMAVQYALYHTLLAEGIKPDKVWGASLGELVAAVVAEVISIETGLLIAIEHARRISQHCPYGGMMAVMTNDSHFAEYQRRWPKLSFGGVNFANHFTVSGDLLSLASLQQYLDEQQISFFKLPVRYAFHSPAILPAKVGFIDFCRQQTWQAQPALPFVSTQAANYVNQVDGDYFWLVVQSSMRFADTVAFLEKQGPHIYIDCGPSGTGATFVKYNLTADSQSIFFSVMTQFGQGQKNIDTIKKLLKTRAG